MREGGFGTAGGRPAAAAVAPRRLGPMPAGRRMTTVDEQLVRAPLASIFALAARVDEWPRHLAHYRYVRYRERDGEGGGLVEMSANRPFGPVGWPTWWLSEMEVRHPLSAAAPAVRFRPVGGITKRMDVEWSFQRAPAGTLVRILHVWDGPRVPVVGPLAATLVIGPVFIHGIASRTLAGLAAAAERTAGA
ncbi:MAG TPA: SRPBCC family protein [Gemmatimonadaceae bacterium]|nr:SRPBCC family protein [Gemmatimonadaceae bacterium]